jgi:hypothetical protein
VFLVQVLLSADSLMMAVDAQSASIAETKHSNSSSGQG